MTASARGRIALLVLVALGLLAGCDTSTHGGVGYWGPGDREKDPFYRPSEDPMARHRYPARGP